MGESMKNAVLLFTSLVLLGVISTPQAENLKDQVKAEVGTVGLHPGMDPGLYVCAANHLHIKGTVHNLASIPVGRIKVSARAFGADGKLLGTATSSTKQASLPSGEKAEINLEFLTLTGPLIEQVKKHELEVLEVAPIRKKSR
jgi:hypothetical protein